MSTISDLKQQILYTKRDTERRTTPEAALAENQLVIMRALIELLERKETRWPPRDDNESHIRLMGEPGPITPQQPQETHLCPSCGKKTPILTSADALELELAKAAPGTVVMSTVDDLKAHIDQYPGKNHEST